MGKDNFGEMKLSTIASIFGIDVDEAMARLRKPARKRQQSHGLTSAAVLDAMEDGTVVSARDIADRTGFPAANVGSCLTGLCAQGHVVRVATGRYRLPGEAQP